MTTAPEKTAADLLAEMYEYAATLRGSQAVGALKLLHHADPAWSDRPEAPKDKGCVHGTRYDPQAPCADCAEVKEPHAADLRTFTNPHTWRRTVRCRLCGQHPSFYTHTGER